MMFLLFSLKFIEWRIGVDGDGLEKIWCPPVNNVFCQNKSTKIIISFMNKYVVEKDKVHSIFQL